MIQSLKRWLILSAAALIVGAAAFAADSFQSTNPSQGIRDKSPTYIAFTNAQIVAAPTVSYPNGTLVIKDGRVVDIGPAVVVPRDAQVIDLSGRIIYPAFIEPYSNYGVEKPQRARRQWGGDGPNYYAERQGADAWNDAIRAEHNWVESFKPDAAESKELMKAGFAVAQSCRLDGIFRGRGFVALLGDGAANDLILNPTAAQFMSFDKGTSKQDYPSSQMGSIALIRQAWYDAEWYTKAQAAFAKNPSQTMPEFNRSVAAIAAAKGSSIVFDPDDDLSLLRADKIAREFVLKHVYLGSGYEYGIIKDVKATGASLILPVNFPKPPYVKTPNDALDVSLADLRHWEWAPLNPKIVAENQIEFAFTSAKLRDRSAMLKKVRAAIKRGLPKTTALAALTTVPARLCGVDKYVGTLEKGKFANFIVCDKDPLAEDAMIFNVYVAGKDNKLQDYPRHDIRGDYKLSWDNKSFDLSVTGKVTRPSANIKLGDKETKLDDLNTDGNLLQFTLKLDTLESGVYRFSGRRSGNDFIGDVALPSGNLIDWKAAFVAMYDEKADTLKKKGRGGAKPSEQDGDREDDDDTTLIAKLTFPNRAYGPSSLPAVENVLIKNATIWTSESEGILENTDLLVTNGKFAQIGRGLAAPAGARVIDAAGKHVTAGIIDEHSHIAISRGVNEGTHAVSAEVRIGDVLNPEDISIYRTLAGGVTMSQLLHGSANPIGGQAQVIKHRWGVGADDLKYDAPPTIKFALGENVKQSNWGDRMTVRYPQTRLGVETIIKDEFTTAREYEAAWRKYGTLSSADKQRTVPPRYDIRLETALEILNSKRFIHCHSYVYHEILMLMRLAEQFGFRIGTFTHVLDGYKVADEMREHGACGNSFADWWAYKFEVYEAIAYNASLMAEKGVVTGINSDDAEMARRLNQEAGKTVLYGNTKPEEALKMVTINPAIQLKVDDRVGSIKVGKEADFVIWSGPPLSTYSKVEQTWVDGRNYFSLEKDLKLRAEIAAEKNALIQKVLKHGGGERSDDNSGYKQPERDWHCEDTFDIWEAMQ